MKLSGTGALVLAVGVALAGCGDDLTGPDGLTRAHAEALAGALFAQSYGIAASVPTGASTVSDAGPMVARAQVTVDQTWNATIPCELGGSVTVDATLQGVVDDQTGAGEIDYAGTQSYDGCQLNGPQGQHQFTLNGAPALIHTAHMTVDAEGARTITGSIATPTGGGLSWSTGDVGETCEMAITYSGSSTPAGAGQFSMSGTICDVSFSRTVSVGAS